MTSIFPRKMTGTNSRINEKRIGIEPPTPNPDKIRHPTNALNVMA